MHAARLHLVRRLIPSGPWLLAIALTLAIPVGFVLIRWVLTTAGIDDKGHVDVAGWESLEHAVSSSELVVVGKAVSESRERIVKNEGPTDTIVKDVTFEIDQFPKGSGPSTITVTQTYGSREKHRLWPDRRTRYDSYVSLTKSRSYVLFLRAATIPGRWFSPAYPIGFAIDGSEVSAAGKVPPSGWESSDLGDLIEAVQSIAAAEAGSSGTPVTR
jgi:hypothetical protein